MRRSDRVEKSRKIKREAHCKPQGKSAGIDWCECEMPSLVHSNVGRRPKISVKLTPRRRLLGISVITGARHGAHACLRNTKSVPPAHSPFVRRPPSCYVSRAAARARDTRSATPSVSSPALPPGRGCAPRNFHTPPHHYTCLHPPHHSPAPRGALSYRTSPRNTAAATPRSNSPWRQQQHLLLLLQHLLPHPRKTKATPTRYVSHASTRPPPAPCIRACIASPAYVAR